MPTESLEKYFPIFFSHDEHTEHILKRESFPPHPAATSTASCRGREKSWLLLSRSLARTMRMFIQGQRRRYMFAV